MFAGRRGLDPGPLTEDSLPSDSEMPEWLRRAVTIDPPMRDVPVPVALQEIEPLASILAAVRAGRTVRRTRIRPVDDPAS